MKKQKGEHCLRLATIVLLACLLLNFIGSTSAKYAKNFKFEDILTVPKNYYTVTYYQHDGTILDSIKCFTNVGHTLRGNQGVLIPDGAESFIGWVNALGNDPDLSKKQDYSLYPSFQYKEASYEVRFMDMKGENLLGSVSFKESQAGSKASSVIKNLPTPPTIEDFEFTGWGVRREGQATIAWEDYTLTKSDVVVYAQYVYSGKLNVNGVDNDNDGVVDYYQVDSTSGLSGEYEIPGYINGIPVAVIVDISDNGEINGLIGNGITKVIINEGTTTIGAEAMAMTADLKEVKLPSTIASIGKNAFASTAGGSIVSKKINIIYNGTWEDWNKIQKDSGWDSGLSSGATVTCTDGVATLSVSGGFLGYGATYTWSFAKN